MQFTINGFSQQAVLDLNINNKLTIGADELALLRWLVDFSASPTMKKIFIDGKVFYWVNYNYVCKELPLIADKIDTIYRKFNKLVTVGILERYTKKNKKGTFSFFAFGTAYQSLVTSTPEKEVVKEPVDELIDELGKKSEMVNSHSEKNPSKSVVTRKNIRTKDPSTTTTDPSINNTHTADQKELCVEIKKVLGKTISQKMVSELVRDYGLDTVQHYIDNWDKYRAFAKKGQDAYFIHCVQYQREVPTAQQATTYNNGQVPQHHNFSQRPYVKDEFEEIFANLVHANQL